MQSYRTKTEEHLRWEDARDEIRAKIRRATRRATNQAYAALDAHWTEALNANQEPDVDIAADEALAAVVKALQLEVGDGDA
jgi:hypothetical protein